MLFLLRREVTFGMTDILLNKFRKSVSEIAMNEQDKKVACDQHGVRGFGLVCTHIAHAVDSGAAVGFFWGDDADLARPDAWCAACESALLAVPAGETTDRWFLSCDYKIFCEVCWDLARERLGPPIK